MVPAPEEIEWTLRWCLLSLAGGARGDELRRFFYVALGDQAGGLGHVRLEADGEARLGAGAGGEASAQAHVYLRWHGVVARGDVTLLVAIGTAVLEIRLPLLGAGGAATLMMQGGKMRQSTGRRSG